MGSRVWLCEARERTACKFCPKWECHRAATLTPSLFPLSPTSFLVLLFSRRSGSFPTHHGRTHPIFSHRHPDRTIYSVPVIRTAWIRNEIPRPGPSGRGRAAFFRARRSLAFTRWPRNLRYVFDTQHDEFVELKKREREERGRRESLLDTGEIRRWMQNSRREREWSQPNDKKSRECKVPRRRSVHR